MELTEKAVNYAEGKVNEVMTRAIAQAYADGYRDGYKDREEEIPIDLRDHKTEYVDLGLPSGTLWAKDYEMEPDKSTAYLPYAKAALMNLPTKEQWEELKLTCKIVKKRYEFVCIGPNGNSISFRKIGYTESDVLINSQPGIARFWIKNIENASDNVSVKMFFNREKRCDEYILVNTFSGYKLPVRLVRTK